MSEKKKKRASSSRLSTLVEDIKVEHEIPVLERIKYPIIWERTTSGYRIQDLQLSKVDHAIDIIKEYYITEETFCRGVNLVGSNEAVDEYLTSVTNWLKDTQSLAAVEEGTGAIVGLLIGRVLDRTVRTQIRLTVGNAVNSDGVLQADKECPPPPCQTIAERYTTSNARKLKGPRSKESKTTPDRMGEFKGSRSKSSAKLNRVAKASVESKLKSRFLAHVIVPMFDDENTMVKHPKLMAIQKIKSYLTSKTDILSLYDVDLFYSIYVLLVTPQHRGKGIAKSLVRCAIDMSRKFECDVVAGIFTSKISQNIAHKEGFKLHEEIRLSQWVINNEEVLTDIEDSDTAAVMAYRIEMPEPFSQPPLVQAPRRSVKIAKIHNAPH